MNLIRTGLVGQDIHSTGPAEVEEAVEEEDHQQPLLEGTLMTETVEKKLSGKEPVVFKGDRAKAQAFSLE